MAATLSRGRQIGLGILITSGLLVAAFPHLLIGGRRIFCGDLWRLDDPVMHFVVAQLRAGSLPLWFPYDGLGIPLLGTAVAGVFHPETLLDLWLGVDAGLTAGALVSVTVAGIGTYALARRLRAPAWAAVVAGVSYAVSGPFTGVLDHGCFHRGAAMLPVFFLGVVLATDEDQRRPLLGTLLAAGALALAVLGGDIESAYVFGLIGIAWVVGATSVAGVVPALRNLGHLVVIGLLGALLAAAQLVPSWTAFAGSDRSGGLPLRQAVYWSLSPLRLPELFTGGSFAAGPVTGLPASAAAAWVAPGGSWVPSVCLGVPVLLGVVLALVFTRPKTRRVDVTLLGIGLGLLWLSLGGHAGLYPLAWRVLPMFGAFRFPEKLVIDAALPLAVLAATGLSRAASGGRRALVASGAVVGILALTAGAGLFVRALSVHPGPHAYGTALASAAGWASALGAIAAALILLPTWRPSLGVLRWLLPLLVVIQLRGLTGGAFDACTAPPEVFAAPSPVADRIDALGGGGDRITVGFSRAPAGDPGSSISLAEQYAVWERAVLLPDHNALFHLRTTERYLPVLPRSWTRVLARHPAAWFGVAVQELGSRWLVTTRRGLAGLGHVSGRVIGEFPGLGATLFRYGASLPRTFVAAPLPEPDDTSALEAMLGPEVRTGRAAVVEGAVPDVSGPTRGKATLVTDLPRRVVIDATLDQPGLVVLSDGFAPGWHATVDGRRVAILRANLLARAVIADAGHHRVVFSYPVSPLLRAAIVTSLATWLLVVVLAIAAGCRRRRRGPPQGSPVKADDEP